MARTNGRQCLKGRSFLQFSLSLFITLFCADLVQATEESVAYCMSAGAENNYDCAEVGTNDRGRSAEINAKFSELQRWLEDEERVSNGKSLSNRPAQTGVDNRLQQKIEFNSRLLASELRQARTLQDNGERSRAFNLINSYLTGNPKDPNGWLLYGINLMDQGKLLAAEDIFSKLILLYPDAPEPYNNLAAIYARRGDNAKAIDMLQQAFSTHPSYARVQLNMKTVYASLATQVNNRILGLDGKDNLVTPNLTILDQVYMATPIAALARVQSEIAILADQPVVTLAKEASQQSFVSFPVAPLERAAAVDQTIEEVSETKVEIAPASLDAIASSAALLSLNPATTKQLTKLIFRWVDAWSERDANQYTSFYIDQYRPDNTVTHKQWMWNIKDRFSALEFIQIGISSISMVALPDGHIRIVFKQDYKSNAFQDSVYKTLLFTSFSNSWKISAETTL